MNITLTDKDLKDSFIGDINDVSKSNFDPNLATDSLEHLTKVADLVEYKGILGHKIFKNRRGAAEVISYGNFIEMEKVLEAVRKIKKDYFEELGIKEES